MSLAKIKTLANSIRVLAIPMPHMHSASVGVFVKTGSRNETADNNGISHFLEHMAFKGTKKRNVQAINLDAELLGIQVNAFTSSEMTAYYMAGLGKHIPNMVSMLAEIVCESTFPVDEIIREREVIMQEAIEADEDPQDRCRTLLDQACYGDHPMGQPIIGTPLNIENFDREDIFKYVNAQYTGANIIVAASGNIDVEAFFGQVEKLFSGIRAGQKHQVEAPKHLASTKTQKNANVSQVFAALSFPCASEQNGHYPAVLASIMLGGGMSSPLWDQVRERSGLAYHISSSVDVGFDHGRFIIEFITSPEKLQTLLSTTAKLIKDHATTIDPVHLERAKNQFSVSCIGTQEQCMAFMEDCVNELFNHGELTPIDKKLAQIDQVTAEQVKEVFAALLKHQPAVSLVGKIKKTLDNKAIF